MPRPLLCLVIIGLLSCYVAEAGSKACAQFSCSSTDAGASVCRSLFGLTGSWAGQLTATSCSNDTQLVCKCTGDQYSREVTVNRSASSGTCLWEGTAFKGVDLCGRTVGECPTSSMCSASSRISLQYCSPKVLPQCRAASADEIVQLDTALNRNQTPSQPDFALYCDRCDGGQYLALVDGDNTGCLPSITAAPAGFTCNPSTTCSGHGCCNSAGQCVCHASSDLGFWATSNCASCNVEYQYDPETRVDCGKAKSQIQVLLITLAGTTITMILPNLAVTFLYLVFGILRRRWSSDNVWRLTTQRRARLLPYRVHSRELYGDAIAPPNDGGYGPAADLVPLRCIPFAASEYFLFRSKRLPKRPSQSVGVVNRLERENGENSRR